MKSISGILQPDKLTHVYVGRSKCGCCVALCTDLGDKFTGQSVAEFIVEGLTVDWVEWQTYLDEIRNEENFMKCPHKDSQLSLLSVSAPSWCSPTNKPH